eukprot:2434285-Amphidinium_carterae.1
MENKMRVEHFTGGCSVESPRERVHSDRKPTVTHHGVAVASTFGFVQRYCGRIRRCTLNMEKFVHFHCLAQLHGTLSKSHVVSVALHVFWGGSLRQCCRLLMVGAIHSCCVRTAAKSHRNGQSHPPPDAWEQQQA